MAGPLGLAAGVTALLGTIGYLVARFGLLTGCSDDFHCDEPLCVP